MPINVQPFQTPTADLSSTSSPAVAALIDAYHKGLITAADIAKRIAAMPAEAAENKARQQVAKEAISPEAVKARQAGHAALGAEAELKAATAGQGLTEKKAEIEAGAFTGDALKYYHDNRALWNVDDEQDSKLSNEQKAKLATAWRANKDVAHSLLGEMKPSGPDLTTTTEKGTETFRPSASGNLNLADPRQREHLSSIAESLLPPVEREARQRARNAVKPPELRTDENAAQSEADQAHTQAKEAVAQQESGVTVTPKVKPPVAVGTVTATAPGEPTPTVEPLTKTNTAAFKLTSTAPADTGIKRGTFGVVTKPVETAPEIAEVARKNPSVQAWQKSMQPLSKLMKSAEDINKYDDVAQRSGRVDLNIPDIELAANFIKSYDPEAVIREFKWDKVKEGTKRTDMMKNALSVINKSGTFNPEQRQAIILAAVGSIKGAEDAARPALKSALDAGARLDESEKTVASGGSMVNYKPPEWFRRSKEAQDFNLGSHVQGGAEHGTTATPSQGPLITLPNGKKVRQVQ